MDKIKFIVFIYFIFILSIYGERIYLKNGNIIDGEIVQQTMTTIQVRTYKGELKTINKDDIRRIDFKFDIRKEEERRRQEEQRRLEEERRKQEEQRRLEEERRKQEEQRRLEEERRKQEEQRRLEEERRKQEEQRRLEEERRKQEEQRRKREPHTQKLYIGFTFDKFYINQSILTSIYRNTYPLDLVFAPLTKITYQQFINYSGPDYVFTTQTKISENHDAWQIRMYMGGSNKRFLWEFYLPLFNFWHTEFSYINDIPAGRIKGYFEGKSFVGDDVYNILNPTFFLLGYNFLFYQDSLLNFYVGYDYTNNKKKWEVYEFLTLPLFGFDTYLNGVVDQNEVPSSYISFEGSGYTLIAEYQKIFQPFILKIRLGTHQLKGLGTYNLEAWDNLNSTNFKYRISYFNKLEGFSYSIRLGIFNENLKSFQSIAFIEYLHREYIPSSIQYKNNEIFFLSNQNTYFNINGVDIVGGDFRTQLFVNFVNHFYPSKIKYEDINVISIGIELKAFY